MTGKTPRSTHTKKKLLLRKITIIALILSFITWGVYSLAFPKVKLNWEAGAKQTYLYKSKSVLDTFEFKNGGRTRVNSYLEGILQFRIYRVDRDKDIVETAFKFEPKELNITGVDTDRIKKMYDSVFLVEFSTSGEPRKFKFSKSLAIEDEHYLCDIIHSIKFVTNNDSRRSWETTESTSTSEIISEYSVAGGKTFEKKRVRYLSKNDVIDSLPTINSSKFMVTLGSSSWISDVKGFEKTTIGNGSEMRITAYLQNELSLLPSESDPFFDDTTSYSDLSTKFTSETIQKNAISAWDSVRNEIYAEQLKNATVQSLLNDLRLKKASAAETTASLKHLFELKKDSLQNAANLVKNGTIPSREYQLILFAMAQFGSNESQGYLFSFIEDKSLPLKLRIDSAVYSGYLNSVSVENVIKLETLSRITRNENGGQLSNTILLALGTMCADKKNEGETADEINRFISNKLNSQPDDTNELSACLAAAGNTHSNDYVKSVSPYTNNQSPTIRQSAVEALQSIDSKEARQEIISVIEKENDTEVLSTALQSSQLKEFNSSISDIVVSRLDGNSQASTRQPIIEYLAQQNTADSSTKKVLQKLMKNEKDPRNRANINLILNKPEYKK